MRVSRKSRAAVGVCVAALAAGSIAWSGSASAAAPSAAKSCKTDPGVTDTEIKLGSIVSTSGAGAAVADALPGMQARIAMANDTGELGKRKITLVQEDDGGDPARNLAAAQKLVEQDQVFAIMPNSLAMPSGAAYLNQQGIPAVGWQLGEAIFGQYDNFIGFQNSGTTHPDDNFSSVHADALAREGAKKVALLGYSQASSARFINQLGKAITNSKTMQVVYQSTDVAAGTTDFSAYVDKIKQSGADSIYLGMDTTASVATINALKQAGVNYTNMNWIGGYDPRVLAVPAVNGVTFAVEWKPFEVMQQDGSKGYVNYNKYLEQVKPGSLHNQLNAAGWLAADAMITGLKESKDCLQRKAFIKNLTSTKNYTADGWFAPITFAKEKGLPNRCYYYATGDTANKTFVPQFEGKRICAAVLYDGAKTIKLDENGYPPAKKK
jgi:branched-chain amino acid transport system substrate-binding protein